MPVYRVNDVGSVGFIDPRDLRPHELPPPAWSYVEEARMLNGSAVSVAGPVEVSTTPTDFGTDTLNALDYYTSPAGTEQWWYVYSDGKIWSVDNNGAINAVEKNLLAFAPYPEEVWVTSKLNGIPLATNNRDQPQCFYNNGAAITNLTESQDFPDWEPGGTYAGATAKIVIGYKNFIVALNLVDTEAYPNMVAWSDAADPGLMPTTWDYNATDNLAGRTVLGADTGAILGAEVLRDSLFIYTEYATYRMDFVGGQFVMRFTKVFDNSGIFGPRCVGKFGEKHFVITKSDIIVHDGQQLVSVGDSRVRNRVFEQLDEDDVNRVWVSPYLVVDEMWIGVPNTQNEFLTALVWQWDESAWSVRSLPDSKHMKDLPTLNASETDDSWTNGLDVNWNDEPNNIWNAGGETGDLRPVATSAIDNKLYYIDAGSNTNQTILRREDINLSSDETTELATDVYPRMQTTSGALVELRMGASRTVEGPIQWQSWRAFDANTDYRIKLRANGRRHAIEFRGLSYELSGYDIGFKGAGGR